VSANLKKLPPIGGITDENYGDVYDFIKNIRLESRDDREQWLTPQASYYAYYQYGTDHIPYNDEINVPEIQNAIIATANIQMQEEPRATLEPVETGEKPLYYWAGPPEIGLMLGLLPEQVGDGPETDEAGNPSEPLPIDEIQAGSLKASAVSVEVSPVLLPGMIRPEWLEEISDQTSAEFWQKTLNVFWDRSNTALFWRQNAVDNLIQGWAPYLVEFDEDNKVFVYTHVPVMHAYIDPVARTVQSADYLGVEFPIDAARALAKYPDLLDVLAQEAHEGRVPPPDGMTPVSERYNRIYRRPMVWLSVWFIRNQEAYMSNEQALGSGLVNQTQNTTTAIDGTGGLPTLAGSTYTHAQTGEELTPGKGNWPTRRALRQITMLGDKIVDDRECEHCDIPVGWNVNIPLPGNSPYGISDVARIRPLQKAESEVLESMVEHTKFFSSPIMVISQSMAEILGPDRVAMGAKPGLVHVVPDDQYMAAGGSPLSIVNPPPLSEAHAQLFPTIKGLTTEMGGNTEVLQGRTDSQASSGRAIEALQSAGTGQVSFKSLRLQDEIACTTKVMLYNLVWRLKTEDLMEIHTKPPHVIRAYQNKGKAAEWNVKPVVSSGGGGVRAQKRALAQQDLELTAITMETYRETVGIDHQLEEERTEAAAARLQRAMGGAVADPEGASETSGGGTPAGSPKPQGDNQPKDKVGGSPIPTRQNPMSNSKP
jgi:hypothetical protein